LILHEDFYSMNKIIIALMAGLTSMNAMAALWLDGKDDYLVTGQAVMGGCSGFTLAVWLKGEAPIIGKNVFLWPIDFRSAGSSSIIGSATTEKRQSGFISWDDDPVPFKWQHIAATWSGRPAGDGKIRLYLNGIKQVGELEFDGKTNLVTLLNTRVYMAYRQGAPFKGLVEDARCYGRALSASEVLEIYAADGKDQVTNGLAFRWLMNGRPGETAEGKGAIKDVSGNTNDGNAFGGPMFTFPVPLDGNDKAMENEMEQYFKDHPDQAQAHAGRKEMIIRTLEIVDRQNQACEKKRDELDQLFKSHPETGRAFRERYEKLNQAFAEIKCKRIYCAGDILDGYRALWAEFGRATLFEK